LCQDQPQAILSPTSHAQATRPTSQGETCNPNITDTVEKYQSRCTRKMVAEFCTELQGINQQHDFCTSHFAQNGLWGVTQAILLKPTRTNAHPPYDIQSLS
jgi:hypothetical protein